LFSHAKCVKTIQKKNKIKNRNQQMALLAFTQQITVQNPHWQKKQHLEACVLF